MELTPTLGGSPRPVRAVVDTATAKGDMSSDSFSSKWSRHSYHPTAKNSLTNQRLVHGTGTRQIKDVPRPLESTSASFRPSIFQKVVDGVDSSRLQTFDNTICIEFLSNWGHPHRIGLTEIQLFDDQGQKIEVSAETMSALGAEDCKGKLPNLINGKSKTVKERYMWSCALSWEPVKLVLGINSGSSVQVASIKIWNYNHSIKDLLIGVRQARIFLGRTLIFDGILDKGCGNQVFDYSQVIRIPSDYALREHQLADPGFNSVLFGKNANWISPLNFATMTDSSRPEYNFDTTSQAQIGFPPKMVGSSKPAFNSTAPAAAEASVEDKTGSSTLNRVSERVSETLKQTSSGHREAKNVQKLGKCDQKKAGERDYNSDSMRKEMSLWSIDVPQSHGASRPSSNTRYGWYSNPETPAKEQSSYESYEYNQTNKPEVQFSPTIPKWLETPQKQDDYHKRTSLGEKPSWLKGIDVDLTEPFKSPPESQPDSRSSSRASSGRIQAMASEPLFELGVLDRISSASKIRDFGLLMENVSCCSSRETSAKYGRRAIPSPIPSSGDPRRRQVNSYTSVELPTAREESARTRTRKNMDNRLEESWSSLHMFNRHHRGRLSINMEGDVLDSYLNVDKPKATEQTSPSEFNCIKSTNSDFIIPELPEGQELVINVLTTWGDLHYVGLNGVEIFSSAGDLVKVQKITARPEDINVLPEYSKDPRVVTNLVDGVYKTWDDMHLWLTPFTPGNDHFVFASFERLVKIAMIRIWNYNKSRIHSFRGARFVIITLDGQCIFKGEIARACGGIKGGIESFGDTILFTTDDDILESIAKNDETFTSYISSSPESVKDEVAFERPRTGYLMNEGERPLTSAEPSSQRKDSVRHWDSFLSATTDAVGESVIFIGQHIQLNIIGNWGDCSFVGLTGIEVLNDLGDPLPVRSLTFSSSSQDDAATAALTRLTDAVNVTTSDNHMWLTSFAEGSDHRINVTLKQPESLIGLRIWNYNKSSEDSYKGIKLLQVYVDGKLVSPSEGFLVRKGPGNCHFDFAQEVLLSGPPPYSLLTASVPNSGDSNKMGHIEDASTQDYEAPMMPRGFVFQLQLYSTWGDPYYVGMNGIEMYDAGGTKIPLTQNNIAAYPDSVNVLDSVSNDVRTPDKLVDNVNDTMDGHHMWLSPILPTILNRIYIVFDYPVTVSMLKLWNYSKTSSRGVKEFGLLVDDLLVYHNILNPVGQVTDAKDISCAALETVPYHTILFTSDKELASREKHSILRNRDVDQDVQLTNDSHVLHKGTSGKAVDQALRPMTSMTSFTPFK